MKKLGIECQPRNPTNLFEWVIYLTFNDPGSPYFGQRYEIEINLSEKYPFECPKAHFVSKIFNPVVNMDTGDICLTWFDREKGDWGGELTLYMVSIGL